MSNTPAGRIQLIDELLNENVYAEDGKTVIGKKDPLITRDQAIELLNFPLNNQKEPSMEFFKKEDADCTNHLTLEDGLIKSRDVSISIDKANRLLKERGTVVYGCGGPNGAGPKTPWYGDRESCKDDIHGIDWSTRQALLVNITQIEEPDTAESLLKEMVEHREHAGKFGIPEVVHWDTLFERAKRLLNK